MKMKILYDPQIFIKKEYGGISRYFFELFMKFYYNEDIEINLPLAYSNNYYLKNAPFIKCRSLVTPVRLKDKNKFLRGILMPVKIVSKMIFKYQNSINSIKLQEALKKQDFDICHLTYYNTSTIKLLTKKPFVITVYDMIYELFPDCFPDNPIAVIKKELIKKANKIIAISNNTKQDLIKIHEVQEAKIEVIHLACSFQRRKIEEGQGNLLPNEYILFVGERKWYKNFVPFIKSIAPLLKKYKNLNIICAGSKAFNKDEKKLFEKLNLSKKIYHYSASDDFLYELYKNAIVFVFPSLYEGFGIPILEAFSAGCPVACSNSSSFPEVAGDAATFFDPYNEESMCNSIDNLISDKNLRDIMINKGYERLKAFSWQETAERTKKLYMSLI
jgi:glycosyltransferase involved in cell wall biosynthesis